MDEEVVGGRCDTRGDGTDEERSRHGDGEQGGRGTRHRCSSADEAPPVVSPAIGRSREDKDDGQLDGLDAERRGAFWRDLFARGDSPPLVAESDAGIDATRTAGAREIPLWVFEGNAGARRFYARHGFVADGRVEHIAELGVAELRMRRTLDVSSPP